jgi:hypothetical protein
MQPGCEQEVCSSFKISLVRQGLEVPQKKQSNGLRSGDHAGHVMRPLTVAVRCLGYGAVTH